MSAATASPILGILLLSGHHGRAHYAFAMAAGAAAVGRRVVLFASNGGCKALLEDWSQLDDVGRDAAIRARGIAGLGELREQARQLDVHMIVCEMGLKAEGLEKARLMAQVHVAGIASFLEAVGHGQIVSL